MTGCAGEVPADLLGTPQVAARCGVGVRTVVRWCLASRLPAYRIGGRWRVSAAELERWLARGRYEVARCGACGAPVTDRPDGPVTTWPAG